MGSVSEPLGAVHCPWRPSSRAGAAGSVPVGAAGLSQHQLRAQLVLCCPQLWPVPPGDTPRWEWLIAVSPESPSPQSQAHTPSGYCASQEAFAVGVAPAGSHLGPPGCSRGQLPPLGTSSSAPQGTLGIPVHQ